MTATVIQTSIKVLRAIERGSLPQGVNVSVPGVHGTRVRLSLPFAFRGQYGGEETAFAYQRRFEDWVKKNFPDGKEHASFRARGIKRHRQKDLLLDSVEYLADGVFVEFYREHVHREPYIARSDARDRKDRVKWMCEACRTYLTVTEAKERGLTS